MRRIDIERADPTVDEKANDHRQPEQTEENSERGDGRSVNAAVLKCVAGGGQTREIGRHGQPKEVDTYLGRSPSRVMRAGGTRIRPCE